MCSKGADALKMLEECLMVLRGCPKGASRQRKGALRMPKGAFKVCLKDA